MVSEACPGQDSTVSITATKTVLHCQGGQELKRTHHRTLTGAKDALFYKDGNEGMQGPQSPQLATDTGQDGQARVAVFFLMLGTNL